MFGNVGQPPREGKKSGAGNEISYNDITFPPTQTLKRRGRGGERPLLGEQDTAAKMSPR